MKNTLMALVLVMSLLGCGKGADLGKKDSDAGELRAEELKNPKVPLVEKGRAILGESNAPIFIVEYADFECWYCAQALKTVQELRTKYGVKVKLMYKHYPLPKHKNALLAAKTFEAIAIQNTEKAYGFYEELYLQQASFKASPTTVLAQLLTKLNVDQDKFLADVNSAEVQRRIDSDMAEFEKFKYTGVPTFLVNGVTLKGSQKISGFEEVFRLKGIIP